METKIHREAIWLQFILKIELMLWLADSYKEKALLLSKWLANKSIFTNFKLN